MNENIIYTLALKETEGIGGVLFRHLVSYFGSAKGVLEAPEGKLLKTPGVGNVAVKAIKSAAQKLDAIEKQLAQCEKNGQRIITFEDAEYPHRFKGLYDAPPVLYVSGTADLNFSRTIGIVGTRKATDYGKFVTEKLIDELKPLNICVVSGLAYGIDIASHKAALKNGLPTVAVMAGGLNKVYPAAHKKYYAEIVKTGAVLSENHPDTIPLGPQFIARNRIIAALSDVVVVVESAKKGGGLITAEYANNYHRDVYAVPGEIGQTYSEGPNRLIQENKAKIFTSAQDLADDMGWSAGSPDKQKDKPVTEAIDLSRFTEDESCILRLLREKGDCQIDDLSFESNIPLNKLASLLLNLEFQDLVKALPGKKFKLR
jgi:DNA processing protein